MSASAQVRELVTDIVAAYLSNNVVATDRIPDVIETVYRAMTGLGQEAPVEAVPAAVPQRPAVSVKKSVQDDYIVCLEDGKKLKMLKRHLRTAFNMTPEEYRAKWNLPDNYPMVAPNYAAQRSEFAKVNGLGKSPARGRRRKGAPVGR